MNTPQFTVQFVPATLTTSEAHYVVNHAAGERVKERNAVEALNLADSLNSAGGRNTANWWWDHFAGREKI